MSLGMTRSIATFTTDEGKTIHVDKGFFLHFSNFSIQSKVTLETVEDIRHSSKVPARKLRYNMCEDPPHWKGNTYISVSICKQQPPISHFIISILHVISGGVQVSKTNTHSWLQNTPLKHTIPPLLWNLTHKKQSSRQQYVPSVTHFSFDLLQSFDVESNQYFSIFPHL